MRTTFSACLTPKSHLQDILYTVFVMDDKIQNIKKDRLKQINSVAKAHAAAAAAAQKTLEKEKTKPKKKSGFFGFGKKKKPAKKPANVSWQWMDDSGWKNYQTDQQTKLEARYASAIPMHSA